MNKTFLITKKELHAYFSTWSGYIVMAAALLLEGLLFQAFAVSNTEKLSSRVLEDFFYFSSGLVIVAGILFSIRLIAEERQNNTLVLYYTSPVSERQLIYGKFFSVLGLLVILQIISLYMPALIFVHGKVSFGHIGVGYLGLVLIGAATAAITVFASSIAPTQLIAAVIGALVTVFILILWIVGDVVAEPFKSIYGYLALHSQHFAPFSRGVLNSRDIFYYVSLSLFFLEAAVQTLAFRRQRG